MELRFEPTQNVSYACMLGYYTKTYHCQKEPDLRFSLFLTESLLWN